MALDQIEGETSGKTRKPAPEYRPDQNDFGEISPELRATIRKCIDADQARIQRLRNRQYQSATE